MARGAVPPLPRPQRLIVMLVVIAFVAWALSYLAEWYEKQKASKK
jgi:hypothetical protein